ncbi:MAG: dihydroorotase [bacterium]
MGRILFSGGKLIDPLKGSIKQCDVLIEDGRIKEVGKKLRNTGAEKFDCQGRFIAPGFIDLHCHLREPGEEHKETIVSGCRAALAGGWTQICPMPNTIPPIDSEALVQFELEAARAANGARVIPVGCCTKARQGKELAELGGMWQAGVRAISDDGSWVSDTGLFRRVLEYAKTFDLLVMTHCEVPELVQELADEGVVSTRLGLYGTPAVAEAIGAIRDIILANWIGTRLHICHVSSRETVELLRWAKSRGMAVTAETCPHYLALTVDKLEDFDTNYKVNPPLRSGDDQKALIRALVDGTIDAIATDHAPHTPEDKEKEFTEAASGIIGFETAFSVLYETLVMKKALTLPELIARLTVVPARILGIEPPQIVPEAEANLVVIDTNLKWVFSEDRILSRSRNTPFLGKTLRARVVASLLGETFHINL